MKTKKTGPTSIRFSVNARQLLELLSEKLDISKASILELAIKDFAEKNKVEIKHG